MTGDALDKITKSFLLLGDTRIDGTISNKSKTSATLKFEKILAGDYTIYVLDENNMYVGFETADDNKLTFT